MSYCRNPHYIYPTGDGVSFDGTLIGDEELDIWLYNMLLICRRSELMERLKHGKECGLAKYDSDFNILADDNIEVIHEKLFINKNEDNIIKLLMNNIKDIDYDEHDNIITGSDAQSILDECKIPQSEKSKENGKKLVEYYDKKYKNKEEFY